MNILKINWRKVFKFAFENVRISNEERSQLMSKYWKLIRALKEAQNQP